MEAVQRSNDKKKKRGVFPVRFLGMFLVAVFFFAVAPSAHAVILSVTGVPAPGLVTGVRLDTNAQIINCQPDCAEAINTAAPNPPIVATKLTATPFPGYVFNGWTNCPVPNGNDCNVDIGAVNIQVGANFSTVNTHTLTLTLNGAVGANNAFVGDGNIQSIQPLLPNGDSVVNCGDGWSICTVTQNTGTNFQLRAWPNSGYGVRYWSSGGSAQICSGSADQFCTFTLNQDAVADVVFGYELSLTKNGPGAAGSIVTGGNMTCGSGCMNAVGVNTKNATAILTANPASGMGVSWAGCDLVYGASGEKCDVSMTGPRSVTATFDNMNISGNTTGWAWSGNTGWISLSCENMNECGTADYKVEFDNNSLRGYAWGGHIGWIYFPADQADGNTKIDLSNCPGSIGQGSPCTPPRVDPSTGAVTGWARALVGMGNSWGWIELSNPGSHPSPGSGVTHNTATGDLTGYAWGGSVIGWISFDANLYGACSSFSLAPANSSVTVNAGDTSLNTVSVTAPPGCNINLSLQSIVNEAGSDVTASQFGAKSVTPGTVNNGAPDSTVSIETKATTLSNTYTVTVRGVDNIGTSKTTSYSMTVLGAPACTYPSGWKGSDGRLICPNDDSGFNGQVLSTLVGSCTAQKKCEYFCGPGYIFDVNANKCISSPILRIQGRPDSGNFSHKEIVTDPVRAGERAVVRWWGANLAPNSCVGIGGDNAIVGGAWIGPKSISSSPTSATTYMSSPLDETNALPSAQCPNSGGLPCYKFNIQCLDLQTPPQSLSASVQVPITWSGKVSCLPYDNPFANGDPLAEIQVGRPMYWVASTTPNVPLGGGSYNYVWSGEEAFPGGFLPAGTDGTCGVGANQHNCNYVRMVYKTTGEKEVFVSVNDGRTSSWCGPVKTTSVLQLIFEEF